MYGRSLRGLKCAKGIQGISLHPPPVLECKLRLLWYVVKAVHQACTAITPLATNTDGFILHPCNRPASVKSVIAKAADSLPMRLIEEYK